MPLSSTNAAQSIVRPGVCTSSTRPASPYDGQMIYMSDVDQSAVWDGSAWVGVERPGGRNYIINGGLDVWQRGTSFSNPASATGFTADRFFPVYDGSGATRTISQGQFDPYVSGASITASPPTGLTPKYFLRWNQSVAGTSATYNILYANRVEDVRRLAGKTVTLSFYAKAAASLTMPKIDIEQGFGSGGSPSSNVYTDVTTDIAVTTSWQRFSFSFAVPSAAGKVIGSTDNTSYTSIRLWLPINTTFTYDIWGVQLEAGAVATPFEFEDFSTTLVKCQRYFEKSYLYTDAPGTNTTQGMAFWSGASNGSGDQVITLKYAVAKRAATPPTFYRYTGTSGSWHYTRSGVAETAMTMSQAYTGHNQVVVYGNVGANWTVCQMYGHWVCDSEL